MQLTTKGTDSMKDPFTVLAQFQYAAAMRNFERGQEVALAQEESDEDDQALLPAPNSFPEDIDSGN